jgi:gamma-D-glutamyl-L-lysine dipeptidyl-peptidase
MKRICVVLWAVTLTWVGCRTQKNAVVMGGLKEEVKNTVEAAMAETRKQYAPDKRVALFKVETASRSGKLTLKGETNLPEAKTDFLEKLRSQGIEFKDSIALLPAADLGDKTYGVVTISVASIRSDPKESAELATQATLGTPLKIYKREGFWCLVQTPDDYISWADVGAIKWMNASQYAAWQSTPKVIYLQPNGYAYTEPNLASQIVSDLVGGSILRFVGEKMGFLHVAYPDGREAYVAKNEAQPYDAWLYSLKVNEESLVNTAKRMMGFPYLWGGTSYKAVDCSGFTKTIFFMNGMIIPRDASQQVHTGKGVDISQGFRELRPGDLLFFGKPATDTTSERVTHVGMWIGNNEFIHASSHVRVSSIDPAAPNYDEFNLKRLLRVKRILDSPEGDIVQLSKSKVF